MSSNRSDLFDHAPAPPPVVPRVGKVVQLRADDAGVRVDIDGQTVVWLRENGKSFECRATDEQLDRLETALRRRREARR